MQLVKYERARIALAEARSVDEVKGIRDAASAMKAYAIQAQDKQMEIDASEIRIRAERRLGEMLKWQEEHGGLNKGTRGLGRPKIGGAHGEPPKQDTPPLADMGISKKLSARSQAIAAIPEAEFEATLAEHREEQEAVTSRTMEKLTKQKQRQEEIDAIKKTISETPQTIQGKFSVVVIDPPWPYGRKYDPETSRVANPYPEMELESIQEIKLPLENNSVVFLWTTHAFLKSAFLILDGWGLDYRATIVWDKEQMGMGATIRMQCEFCLMATLGKPIIQGAAERDIIREKRREHSRKPDAFYSMVDRMTVGRKLDYFSRQKRNDWICYGAETNKF